MEGSNARYLRAVILITFVTAVGGFLFGFDNGAISGSAGFIQDRFGLGPAGLGWVTSSIIVGCVIGVIVAGRVSDAIGRKKVLLGTALIFTVGAVLEALAPSAGALVAARVLVGVGIGVETTIAPLYIAEVAPARLRGRLVSFNQLFNTIGNLAIFTVSAVVSHANTAAWNTDQGWRWIFAAGVVPAALFVCLLYLVPESPRWLAKKGRDDAALAVLARITDSAGAATAQLGVIRASLAGETRTGLRELWVPGLRKALVIGFGVAFFQQITGINAIFYYAPEVFQAAGLGTDGAMMSTVLVGVVLVAATLVSMWLIDKVGRRSLLLFGATCMTVALAAVGYLFRDPAQYSVLLVALVLAYVAVFAVSFGTVAYVVISEIFPTHVRGLAASIATFALWGGNFLVSQLFPVLTAGIGSSSTFFIFAGTSLLALIFTYTLVPETKGRTLEELSGALGGGVTEPVRARR